MEDEALKIGREDAKKQQLKETKRYKSDAASLKQNAPQTRQGESSFAAVARV